MRLVLPPEKVSAGLSASAAGNARRHGAQAVSGHPAVAVPRADGIRRGPRPAAARCLPDLELPLNLSRALTGGALLALLAGTAACGLQSVAPKVELRNAAVDLGNARSAAFTVSLPSSPADVRAFLAAGNSSGGDAGTMDATTLRQLLASQLTVAYDRGANAASSADDAGRIAVRIGGVDAGELRMVKDTAYLRVNVPGLTKEFPQLADGVNGARESLGSPELGALRAPATAALDGKWISVDAGKNSWLAQQSRTVGGADTRLPADFAQRLQKVAGKAFQSSVAVRSAGEDATGDHLVATVNTRKAYTAIRGDLPGLFTGDTAKALSTSLPAAADVPSRNVDVSFWVHDGSLRRIELDAAQFLTKPAGHLVIRIDVRGGQPITAPTGATPLDLAQLQQATGASTDSLLGDLTNSAQTDVDTLATQVDKELLALSAFDNSAPSLKYLPQARSDMASLGADIRAVGGRVQVSLHGKFACLTLGRTVGADGTITAGRC